MRSYPQLRRVPLADRSRFNLLFALQHYFPQNGALKAHKDKVRMQIAESLQRGGPGRTIPIDRRIGLSPEEFRDRYLAHGLPVILEGAARDWACTREWSFDGFKRRFGRETIKLVQRIGLSDDDFVDAREFTEEIVFGEFLDQVLSGGRKYMRFSPLLEQFPELLGDFDQGFLQGMPGNTWGSTYQLFIGAQRTFTPLHNAITPFFFVNICGIKRWQFIPCAYLAILNPDPEGLTYNHSSADLAAPDLAAYPGLDCIDRMEGLMQPGDILFNPSWMWHSVQNEAPTIGVRCGFIHPPGMLRESLTLTLIRAFAGNPSMLQTAYYSFIKPNLPDREDMLLTPRVFKPPPRK